MPLVPPDFKVEQGKFTNLGILRSFVLKRYFNCISGFIQDKEYSSICDVGCGEGVPLTILKPFLGNAVLHGIDLSENKIRFIKENIPEGIFVQGSAYNIPFVETVFDLVFCLEVLEHLEKPQKAMKEIKKIAKRDIILGVPNEPIWSMSNMLRLKYLSSFGNTPNHCQKWTSGLFGAFVSRYFKIIRIKTVFPWTLIHASAENPVFPDKPE